MKARTLKPNKINVITLGCAKNIYDSEVLMNQIRASHIEVEHESKSEDAQIVIINTCGFIESAKQESIDTILRFADAKEQGYIQKLYVTGCLSQRYKEDLMAEISQVDAFFGTKDMPALLKTIKANYKKELVGERLLTTPRHFSYLKISEGCDRPCSFCAIPLMRGKHKSTPIEMLVERTQNLVQQGTKEIILIAQDLTYYGLDLYKKRSLAELLNKLAQIQNLDWIRLHYAYPAGFPLEILDVIKSHDNICNYLDMPLQHISDSILKSMRRTITKKKTNELIDIIRTKIPDIALRTTLITGYPGETEQNFEELADWVQETKFDRLGVFPYSHEEDTHAYNFKDDVFDDIKKERTQTIMEIQQNISFEKNQKFIGQIHKILFDKKEGDFYIGRTEFDSPEVDNEILVDAKEFNITIGEFYNVKIHTAEDFDLYGTII